MHDALWTKVAFLLKEGQSGDSPMHYRLLMILSKAYRIWAATRNAQLDAWAAKWLPRELYGAGPGSGAPDAAYDTAIRLEHALIKVRHRATDSTGERP